LRLNEDYSNSQKELEKERELRKHSQGEAEDALRDMKNAKEKMGEERRAKEQLQVEVSQLQKDLISERTKSTLLQERMDSKINEFTNELRDREAHWKTEKQSYDERIELLKSELSKEKINSEKEKNKLESDLLQQSKTEKDEYKKEMITKFNAEITKRKEDWDEQKNNELHELEESFKEQMMKKIDTMKNDFNKKFEENLEIETKKIEQEKMDEMKSIRELHEEDIRKQIDEIQIHHNNLITNLKNEHDIEKENLKNSITEQFESKLISEYEKGRRDILSNLVGNEEKTVKLENGDLGSHQVEEHHATVGDTVSQKNTVEEFPDTKIVEDSSWGDTIDTESRNLMLKALNERSDDSWEKESKRGVQEIFNTDGNNNINTIEEANEDNLFESKEVKNNDMELEESLIDMVPRILDNSNEITVDNNEIKEIGDEITQPVIVKNGDELSSLSDEENIKTQSNDVTVNDHDNLDDKDIFDYNEDKNFEIFSDTKDKQIDNTGQNENKDDELFDNINEPEIKNENKDDELFDNINEPENKDENKDDNFFDNINETEIKNENKDDELFDNINETEIKNENKDENKYDDFFDNINEPEIENENNPAMKK